MERRHQALLEEAWQELLSISKEDRRIPFFLAFDTYFRKPIKPEPFFPTSSLQVDYAKEQLGRNKDAVAENVIQSKIKTFLFARKYDNPEVRRGLALRRGPQGFRITLTHDDLLEKHPTISYGDKITNVEKFIRQHSRKQERITPYLYVYWLIAWVFGVRPDIFKMLLTDRCLPWKKNEGLKEKLLAEEWQRVKSSNKGEVRRIYLQSARQIENLNEALEIKTGLVSSDKASWKKSPDKLFRKSRRGDGGQIRSRLLEHYPEWMLLIDGGKLHLGVERDPLNHIRPVHFSTVNVPRPEWLKKSMDELRQRGGMRTEGGWLQVETDPQRVLTDVLGIPFVIP